MFAAPHATTTMSPAIRSSPPSRSTTTSVTAVPASFVVEPDDLRVRQQRDVRVLERRPHAEHLGVGLARGRGTGSRRRSRSGRRCCRACSPRRAGSRTARGTGGSPAAARSSRELLDPRLVGDRRVRVRRARRRLGRVLAAVAVHLVELLGQRVVRLDLVVGDRPRGRDAVVVAELAEVLLAQPVERRAVQLGRAADEVVDTGLERLALVVVPGVGRDVAVVHEHVVGRPVLRLAREPVAALEQQDPLAGRREVAGERAAARAGADDDHVVAVHWSLLRRGSARLEPPAPVRGRGDRFRDVLERLALGLDPDRELDDPADDHDPSADRRSR